MLNCSQIDKPIRLVMCDTSNNKPAAMFAGMGGRFTSGSDYNTLLNVYSIQDDLNIAVQQISSSSNTVNTRNPLKQWPPGPYSWLASCVLSQ
jgi:hypothetical protein